MAKYIKQNQHTGLRSLFSDFFRSGKASGILLIVCTALSLLIANSPWGNAYHHLWETSIGPFSLEFWINDGLMAVFFLMVGLEIERELYVGELSSPRQALLPIVAALGGMLVPAAIHYAFNRDTPTVGGFGIPMATDIAFALGILSLAGKSVPTSLKIFLTALAIIDDLGAILVIAIFYTHELSLLDLSLALGIFIALFILGKLGMRRLIFFLIPGAFMWYFMHNPACMPPSVASYWPSRSRLAVPEKNPHRTGCSMRCTIRLPLALCRCLRWPIPASCSNQLFTTAFFR